MSEIRDLSALRSAIARHVEASPAFDIHTHLYAEAFGDLLLRGPTELLTYHYLQAEANRVIVDLSPAAFVALPKEQQARIIWQKLFVERSPISEATRGVVTAWRRLGISDPRSYEEAKARFAGLSAAEHIDLVLRTANVSAVVMTNDPFHPTEQAVWRAGGARDRRFLAALRIDPLLLDWPASAGRLQTQGYAAGAELDETTLDEARRFLRDWAQRMQALYIAASLPPSFMMPNAAEPYGRLLEQAVLPVCREMELPFAMMIGVKRGVAPELAAAGDALGRCNLEAVGHLCRAWPDNKFLLTVLARENQHEAVVLARKFRNLHLFGCWWFNNNPSIMEEITRERVEMLGLSVTLQHSDARILDQLVYKWAHSRQIIAEALGEKYGYLISEGWYPTQEEIARDVQMLLGGEFLRFAGRR
jgi:hypothetical protein